MAHSETLLATRVRYLDSDAGGGRNPDARFLRLVDGDSGEAEGGGLSGDGAVLECGFLAEQGSALAMRTTKHADSSDESAAPPAARTCLSGDGEAPPAPAPRLSETRQRIVEELYRAYRHRVEAFARRLVGPAEAEEITQETFVRLSRVRNLERMAIGVAYLLRIAQNLARRKFERAERYRAALERSGRNRPREFESSDDRGFASPAKPSVAREGGSSGVALDAERLEAVLRLLSEEEQAAIRLIVCQGLEYQAAARALGVNVSTVNNWKHRGLTKLKLLVGLESSARTTSRRRHAAV
ncbi:MAG: RNA polymerase sigma factor [Planctomycetota bacterium]